MLPINAERIRFAAVGVFVLIVVVVHDLVLNLFVLLVGLLAFVGLCFAVFFRRGALLKRFFPGLMRQWQRETRLRKYLTTFLLFFVLLVNDPPFSFLHVSSVWRLGLSWVVLAFMLVLFLLPPKRRIPDSSLLHS